MITVNKLKIKGFGSFQQREFHLAPGLNVIYGGNEAGKSTIHCFIEAMLFGFWQPFSFQRELSPRYEKYRPWSGSDYGGEMEYSWSDGKVRVTRDFTNHKVALWDLETNSPIDEFPLNSWGEPDYASLHFGLSKTVFRNTISISQLGSATDSAVAQEVSNLARSGGSGVSIEQGLEMLTVSRRRFEGELNAVSGRLEAAKQRLVEARLQTGEAAALENRQYQVTAHLEELNKKRKNWRELVAKAQGQAASAKLERLDNLRMGIETAQSELAQLGNAVADAGQYQEWQGLDDKRNLASECHKSCAQALEEIVYRRRRLEETLKELSAYSGYNQDAIIEMSSAWQVQAKSRQVIEEMEMELAQLDEEIRIVAGRLSDLPHFRPDALEQAAALHSMAATTGVQGPRQTTTTELEQQQRRVNSGKALRWMLVFALPAAGAAAWLEPFLALLALPLLAGILAVSKSIKAAAVLSRNLRREIYSTELEYVNDQRLREHARKELESFLASIGASDLTEMKAMFQSFLEYTDKNYQLLREQKFISGKLEEYYRESEQKGQELTKILSTVGLETAPIEQALATFRVNIDRYLEARDQMKLIEAEEVEAEQKAEKARVELAEAEAGSANFLEALAVGSPEELAAAAQSGGRRQQLEAEITVLEQRMQDILDGVEEAELRRQAEGADPGIERQGPENLANKIEDIEEEALRLQSEKSEGMGRLEGLYSSLPSVADIEEECWLLEAEGEEISAKLQGIELAIATVSRLAEEQKNQIAPELNEMVSALVGRITGGKYNKVQVDQDMSIKAFVAGNTDPVELDKLSGGTIDQIYFASRVAIADLVTGGGLPLLLDDSFVQYDDRRLAHMLALLLELAADRQIVLLTCQQREVAELARLGGEQYKLIDLEN